MHPVPKLDNTETELRLQPQPRQAMIDLVPTVSLPKFLCLGRGRGTESDAHEEAGDQRRDRMFNVLERVGQTIVQITTVLQHDATEVQTGTCPLRLWLHGGRRVEGHYA